MAKKFICTKDFFTGTTDELVCEFDAYNNYEILTEFYDNVPECCSFPKEVYFEDGPNDDWEDFVIWKDGKIASRAGIWKYSDEAWEVAGVITRPEYRQKGYSSRIVRHCIAKILEQGRIATCTTGEDNIAMIKTAIKAGFKIR